MSLLYNILTKFKTFKFFKKKKNIKLLKFLQNRDRLEKVHMEITMFKCVIFEKACSSFCLKVNISCNICSKLI